MRGASWWRLAAALLLAAAAGVRRCACKNEEAHWMAGEWAQVDYSIYHTKCARALRRARRAPPASVRLHCCPAQRAFAQRAASAALARRP
jgi:hypothetical protein